MFAGFTLEIYAGRSYRRLEIKTCLVFPQFSSGSCCDYILFYLVEENIIFCFPLMAVVISQFSCLKLILVAGSGR